MSNRTSVSERIEVPNHKAPEGFVEVKLDIPAWKPELFTKRQEPGSDVEVYTGDPLVGVVKEYLNFGDRIDEQTGKPQLDDEGVVKQVEAIVVLLEAPITAIKRDKTKVALKSGDEVLFFPTARIFQAFTKATRHPLQIVANHPTQMLRIWCQPTTRTPMPTDPKRRLWDYKFQVHPKAVRREGSLALGASFDPPAMQAAIAAAAGTNGQAAHAG